jgi:FkbM family methyltransferase
MIDWTKRPILIYGTGTFARDVFAGLSRHDMIIGGFLDHASRQSEVLGLPVHAPDALPSETRASAAVVIGIHNRDANIAAIIERLKALDYSRIITPIDLYDHFATDLGERYWLTKRTFYDSHQAEIESTARLFADLPSRDLFEAILHFRASGDYSLLPEPDMQRQYFPSNLPAWKTPLRLMDCGAYDGDTLREIITLGIPIEALAAYEPDEANFRKLAETVQRNQIPNAVLWPCGVYSSTSQLRFTTGQGEASGITSGGETVVQCVSIDESTPFFAPTLIKMDIEGAEPEALRGAEKTIAAYKPGLAICIYHAPQHLWEIPLLTHQFAQKYDIRYCYYLRTYAFNTFETVFYAIPSKHKLPV